TSQGANHGCAGGDFRRRLLLVPRALLPRARGRARRGVGLLRRPRREPGLRGGLLRHDRPCRGGEGDLRSRPHRLSRAARGVLRDPRPDHPGPPGQRCRAPVPLGDLPPGRGAGRYRARGHRVAGGRAGLRCAHRHPDRGQRAVLPGRGLPPALLREQSVAGLLPHGRRAEACEIPVALRRPAPALSAAHRAARAAVDSSRVPARRAGRMQSLEGKLMAMRILSRLAGLFVVLGMLGGCGYNAIQAADEATKSAWSEVLNQYQRRADLIPNLVNTVKGYAEQERDVLLGVTEARARVGQVQVNPDDPDSLRQFEDAQADLGSALSRLLVVVENYPQLKSDAAFRDLQAQLEGTENRIAVARKRYIDSVQEFNVLVRQFPVNLTAMVMGYEAKPQFSVANEAEISRPPSVDFGSREESK